MEPRDWFRLMQKLKHYPLRLLLDVYPLSRSEYRTNNLARRASYDYLTQTIEASVVMCRSFVARVTHPVTGKEPRSSPIRGSKSTAPPSVGETMWQTFANAGQLGVIPPNLADDLIGLAALRNKTIHDNTIVDDQLQLYGRLLLLICAGFAAYEAFGLLLQPGNASATPGETVIDRQFIEDLLSRRSTNQAKRALSRLAAERTAPRYVISRREADRFFRLVRNVQSTGD